MKDKDKKRLRQLCSGLRTLVGPKGESHVQGIERLFGEQRRAYAALKWNMPGGRECQQELRTPNVTLGNVEAWKYKVNEAEKRAKEAEERAEEAEERAKVSQETNKLLQANCYALQEKAAKWNKRLYLWPLDAGLGCFCRRLDVSDKSIRLLRPLVMRGGGRLRSGKLVFRLKDTPDSAMFDISTSVEPGRTLPLVVYGLVKTSTDSELVWHNLHQIAEATTCLCPSREARKVYPWLGMVMLPSIVPVRPELLQTVSMTGQGIAWTWLETAGELSAVA